ncbi:hypothetical protein EMIT0232MI5_30131 [Pseudomonas sp. IT-232MI5]
MGLEQFIWNIWTVRYKLHPCTASQLMATSHLFARYVARVKLLRHQYYRKRSVAKDCFWPILLKQSASNSTVEKYALEIEI